MNLSKLSFFQRTLYDTIKSGLWYDVYQDQGSGGEALPPWFHREQKQPMRTLLPLLQAGAIKIRRVGMCHMPQVWKNS